MKRGFTIIELLVASSLLGMLVTILTMIFNQSSIAWRIGIAGVADLGDTRYTIGTVRELADNVFVYDNRGYRMLGLWNENGNLRTRACDVDNEASANGMTSRFFTWTGLSPNANMTPRAFKPTNVGSGASAGSFDTYIVNVKSNGPDREPDTWDDIWSFPDDPTEW